MSITIAEVKDTISRMADIIIENEVYFCELDSAAGDGDFGMSLAKGFRELKAQIDRIDGESIQRFLKDCSMILFEFCGGASGPIWGSAFGAAASAAKGMDVLRPEDVAQMFVQAVEGIKKRGGAEKGDKTLLDALIPAAEALGKAASEGRTFGEGFRLAAIAAASGAESTKTMVASKGRASYLGERSLSHPDAGAVAISVIMNDLLV